jgi:uncharacterized delta-60 repeat protein
MARASRLAVWSVVGSAFAGLGALAGAAAGDFDAGFGSGGVAVTSVAGASQVRATVVQPDGRVVLGGWDASPQQRWRLMRYAADGTLDTTFGSGGSTVLFPTSVVPGGPVVGVHTMALDGYEILAGGSSVVATTKKGGATGGATVARLTQDGLLASSFGSGGKVVLSVPGGGTGVLSIAVQPDGKIVVAGTTSFRVRSTSQQGWYVARLLPSGAIDSGFGSGGYVLHDPSSSEDRLGGHSVAVLSDGRIVVAGSMLDVPAGSWHVARFSASGALESTVTRIGQGLLDGMGVDSSGRVVVVGRNAFTLESVLRRYESTGTGLSLDTAFGDAGETVVMTPNTAQFLTNSGLAFGPSGEVVACGMARPTTTSTTGTAWVYRLDGDGLLDGAFGSAGFAGPVDVLDFNLAWGIARDSSGRIVVGGNSFDSGPGAAWAWFAARLAWN